MSCDRQPHPNLQVRLAEVADTQAAKEEADGRVRLATAAADAASAVHRTSLASLAGCSAKLAERTAAARDAEAGAVHFAGLSAKAGTAQVTREVEWRRWEDRLGAPDALSSLEEEDLSTLLAMLGRCRWIEPFKAHGITVGMLKTLTAAELAHVLAGAEGSRFGDMRDFTLALQHIDAIGGLPPPIAARDAACADAAVPLWSPAQVAAHFSDERGMPTAAEQCLAHAMSGRVLLSMDHNDIFTQLKLPEGIAEHRKFETAIADLKAHEVTRLPAVGPHVAETTNILSAAMAQALTNEDSAPTEFPLAFVRRFTRGFNDSHLEGKGGFGCVYRGVDPVSGVRFAVKRLPDQAHATPHQRQAAEQSMQRELEVLRTTRHPHMIRLLGYCVPGATSTELCLLYELGVHGSVAGNLTDDAKAAAFGWKYRVRALVALSSVLNYMHRSSQPPIFHRDVKSANMVLDHTMSVKLIDCGLAKLLSEEETNDFAAGKTLFTMAGAGGVLGTPGYMCPRYASGGKFGEKSEMFSFGVVVLELLTGRLTQDVPDGGLYNHYLHPEDHEADLTVAAADGRLGWPAAVAEAAIEVARKCAGAYKRRPAMQAVLRDLRAVERKHCELTVDDVQLRVAGLRDQNLALVQTRQDELRQRHRDAQRAEQEQAAAQRTCCICYDDFQMDAGVECTATSGTVHFVCGDCFNGHVLAESEKDLHDVTKRKGQMFCPLKLHGCTGTEPYPQNAVAAHTTPAVFAAFVRARDQLKEQEIVHNMEVQFEQRLAAERRRTSEMRADELKVEKMRCHIVDRILTLQCPRCNAAFLDFEGCFALKCHRCDCQFCAYCLADCGRDAHPHVARCAENTNAANVFGTAAIFEAAQQARRKRMVVAYLADVADEVRADVVAACAQEFADLALNIDT